MTIPFQQYIDSWMTKAAHDIMSAQRLLDIEPVILDNACFHCQQAVEKSLKAYLIYKGEEIEKTQDVIFLLGVCRKYDAVFSTIDPMDINLYAVRGRYPDASLMPDIEEAKLYFELANNIFTKVKERLVF